MVGRIITTDACVAEGAEWLAAAEPRFAHALTQTGPLPLRRREDGFGALLSAIVSQQVSVASANAIWARLGAAGLTDRAVMAAASDDDLRAAGLSRQKARYGRALAQSGADGVMLGRGAQGQPWLLAEIATAIYGTPAPQVPTGAALADLVIEHYEAILSFYGSGLGSRVARKHLDCYMQSANITQHRAEILTSTSPATVAALLQESFCEREAA
jgi:hypothetical protein